jgi:hypothetical protein
MKRYWNLHSIPELAPFTEAVREEKIRDASRATSRHWTTWASIVLMGACAAAGSLLADVFLPIGIWGAAIGGGVGGFLFSWFRRNTIVQFIRKGLALV